MRWIIEEVSAYGELLRYEVRLDSKGSNWSIIKATYKFDPTEAGLNAARRRRDAMNKEYHTTRKVID